MRCVDPSYVDFDILSTFSRPTLAFVHCELWCFSAVFRFSGLITFTIFYRIRVPFPDSSWFTVCIECFIPQIITRKQIQILTILCRFLPDCGVRRSFKCDLGSCTEWTFYLADIKRCFENWKTYLHLLNVTVKTRRWMKILHVKDSNWTWNWIIWTYLEIASSKKHKCFLLICTRIFCRHVRYPNGVIGLSRFGAMCSYMESSSIVSVSGRRGIGTSLKCRSSLWDTCLRFADYGLQFSPLHECVSTADLRRMTGFFTTYIDNIGIGLFEALCILSY